MEEGVTLEFEVARTKSLKTNVRSCDVGKVIDGGPAEYMPTFFFAVQREEFLDGARESVAKFQSMFELRRVKRRGERKGKSPRKQPRMDTDVYRTERRKRSADIPVRSSIQVLGGP